MSVQVEESQQSQNNARHPRPSLLAPPRLSSPPKSPPSLRSASQASVAVVAPDDNAVGSEAIVHICAGRRKAKVRGREWEHMFTGNEEACKTVRQQQ